MCAGRGHNCKLQENLRKCCRLTAFAGVLHSFLALERNKIIFLLRWMMVVQDCLQNGGLRCACGKGNRRRGCAGGLRGNYGVALRGWGGWLAAAAAFRSRWRGVAEKQGVRSALGYRDMPHPHPVPILPLSPAETWVAEKQAAGSCKEGGEKIIKPPAAVARLWQSRRATGSNPVCGLQSLLSYTPHDGWRF